MVIAAVLFIAALDTIADYVVNWLWMRQLGYGNIFWTIFSVGWAIAALRETVGSFRLAAFNLVRERNQPRKLIAVNFMIALDNVVDDAASLIGRRSVFVRARGSCRAACETV